MTSVDRLIERCFAASPRVRYVAVYWRGDLTLRQRDGLQGASSAESDRYEELLVNPALLTLTRQRGAIDCGGLTYILIRYGNFFTFLQPIPEGHVNVGLEPDVDAHAALPALESVIATWSVAEGT